MARPGRPCQENSCPPIRCSTITAPSPRRFYDLDKPPGALPDVAFHLERFAGFAGTILEPACGSGRALLPLLEAGCAVTGFDPSPAMLERCARRCAERGFAPALSAQRFEDFHYDAPFEAIFVPAGSFTLIDTHAAAMDVLRRFRDHLLPGGLLVVDLQPLRALGEDADDRRVWTAPNGDLLAFDGRRLNTDWLGQGIEALGRYERWRDNRLIESELMRWSQRLWGLEEFRLALGATGFADIKAIGGYDRRRAPRPGDRVLTFEAVRI